MGLTKDLFQEMRELETFSNISMREEVWSNLKKVFDRDDIPYRHHFNKQVNSLYDTDETLKLLHKEIRKVKAKIVEREQYLNKTNGK